MRHRYLAGSFLFLASLGLTVFSLLPSHAQTSRKMMNLQGRLTDTEGSPTTGPHLFELRIFDAGAAGAGNQLYYEAQRVEVNKGIYNILVGDGYSSFTGEDPDSYAVAGGQTGGIPASVFNRDNLWLEIEIDEDNPLDPRTRVVSAAYSFNADTLDGKDSSAFVELGGDASFADTQVNTLSFTGGGDLDSGKVQGLTGGAETALHSHPSAGVRITRYYPEFYSPRHNRPYHNTNSGNPEGTSPSGGGVQHRGDIFRDCWGPARYAQKITKFKANTKWLITWYFSYRIREPHNQWTWGRDAGGTNSKNNHKCRFRMQINGSWVSSDYSYMSRPHRGGGAYGWFLQGYAQDANDQASVTTELTGYGAGDYNLTLHSCFYNPNRNVRGPYGCTVQAHQAMGNYIEAIEIDP